MHTVRLWLRLKTEDRRPLLRLARYLNSNLYTNASSRPPLAW
jgi:hypothetical protein